MLSENSKNDLSDALVVIGAIALSLFGMLAFIASCALVFIALSGGPAYQAQKSYYHACQRQFKAGIFQPECITSITKR